MTYGMGYLLKFNIRESKNGLKGQEDEVTLFNIHTDTNKTVFFFNFSTQLLLQQQQQNTFYIPRK